MTLPLPHMKARPQTPPAVSAYAGLPLPPPSAFSQRATKHPFYSMQIGDVVTLEPLDHAYPGQRRDQVISSLRATASRLRKIYGYNFRVLAHHSHATITVLRLADHPHGGLDAIRSKRKSRSKKVLPSP